MSCQGSVISTDSTTAVTRRASRRLRGAAGFLALLAVLAGGTPASAQNVILAPEDTPNGYLARLLINEVPFPGERSWVSEEESADAQRAILWVLRNRLYNIPRGYTQQQVAAATTDDVIDLLTAGGSKGQVDGFYRGPRGRPAMTDRVTERVDYLLMVANRGTPGRFARMLNRSQELADDFINTTPADPFADLREVDGVRVTGSAYGWMTDLQAFHPGGNFVRIHDEWRGGVGGNRFFTLRAIR